MTASNALESLDPRVESAGSSTRDGGRVNLFGLSRTELESWMADRNQPSYRAAQLHQWLYQKRVRDFDAMTNLPKRLRTELAAGASIGRLKVVARLRSQMDDTVKFLFELEDGERVESVLMYDRGRVTLCVSSQVGCGQGCTFCATAQLGLRRNMTCGEILNQVVQVEEQIGVGTITNVVFMGMGEPLANYTHLMRALEILSAPDGLGIAARHVTVSTSGLVPAIRRFAGEGLRVGLALSLNATTDAVRNELIPSNRRYSIKNVLASCGEWARVSKRRLTVEYVLLRGVNDSAEDARRLTRLLRSMPSKVNLIPFNPIFGGPYGRPTDRQIEMFQRILREAHYVATIRHTKGHDIDAACGQLRARYGDVSSPLPPKIRELVGA